MNGPVGLDDDGITVVSVYATTFGGIMYNDEVVHSILYTLNDTSATTS